MHQPQAIFGGSKRSTRKLHCLNMCARAIRIPSPRQPSLLYHASLAHPASGSALPRCTLCWHFAKRLLTFRARPVCSLCLCCQSGLERSFSRPPRQLSSSSRAASMRRGAFRSSGPVCGRDVRDVSRRAIAARRRVSRRSVMPSVHGLQRGHSERCMHAAHVSDDVQWP